MFGHPQTPLGSRGAQASPWMFDPTSEGEILKDTNTSFRFAHEKQKTRPFSWITQGEVQEILLMTREQQ